MPENTNGVSNGWVSQPITVQKPSVESESVDKPIAGGDTSDAITNADVKESKEATAKAVTPLEDDKSEAFVGGSKKARDLGESRKKFAVIAIEAAKKDITAKKRLIEAAEKDSTLKKYLESKFPTDYQNLFNQNEEQDENTSKNTVAKMQASLDFLSEELREERVSEADDLAVKLRFTRDEAERMKKLTQALEAQGFEWTDALERAAFSIRPDKARVGITSLPTMTVAPQTLEKDKEDSKMESLAELQHYATGRSKEEIKQSLKELSKQINGNVYSVKK